MSLSFERALQITLALEGGYSDAQNDHGGPTQWGVTQKVYDAYRDKQEVFRQPVIQINAMEARDIYQSLYWEPCYCDHMPMDLGLCVFDAAVNHGTKRAIKLLQKILSVDQDGVFGPQTASKFEDVLAIMGEHDMVRLYLDERRDFYADIVDNDPTQAVFARGWDNRVNRLARLTLDRPGEMAVAT